jgi:crotonobetaine/carnitine-CoA ligase
VRFAFCIAVPGTIQRQFEERFGVRLIDGYGITEGGQISYSPYDAPKVGSCGVPVPLYEVELHDEHGSPVPTGEVGEIVVRPRRAGVCMDGYLNDPVATLAAFRDLWLHTGDLGRFDDEGHLYFVDRAKDAIRRRGENISSVEVELAASRHAAVAEVAAYPVPSELGEDEVMLAVVVRDGEQLSAEELLAHCRETLPRFAVPRYIRFVDSLPRTPTQKVAKYRLRAEGITADAHETAGAR